LSSSTSDSTAKNIKGEGNNKARFQAKLADGCSDIWGEGRVVGSTLSSKQKAKPDKRTKIHLGLSLRLA
jgi:hypothetical protein